MKRQYWLYAFVMVAMLLLPVMAEAQVVYVNGVAYVPANGYYGGIPAAHGPVANGTVRHLNNGYIGVNPRHYSRIPMAYGTGPIRATGPIVTYRHHRHGLHRGGYGGGYGHRSGYVHGNYHGSGWHVQGGISFSSR